MKKTLTILATAATIAMTGTALAEEKLKVGFIYIGPPGDFGWTYQHDQARKELEKELGDKITTSYLESVPEGADAERAIERFARSGCKIVFTTSFGYMDATNAVAANALRGYKKALVPMLAFAVGLWGLGLGGGYLLAYTDLMGAARGAPGFWMGAIAGMAVAAASVTLYFARVSRMAMESADRHKTGAAGQDIQRA